jgi:hypothetical protein
MYMRRLHEKTYGKYGGHTLETLGFKGGLYADLRDAQKKGETEKVKELKKIMEINKREFFKLKKRFKIEVRIERGPDWKTLDSFHVSDFFHYRLHHPWQTGPHHMLNLHSRIFELDKYNLKAGFPTFLY